MIYCFDTSAFIHAAVRAYPLKNIVSFWRKVDDLIDDNRLYCPVAVIKEIEKKDDELCNWIKPRAAKIAIEADARIQSSVVKIMSDPIMSKLVDIERDRSGADPFVLATAQALGYVVVTQEDYGKANKPKIPNIADMLKLKCVKLVDVIVAENWII
jgi:hypothetical protein